MKRKKRKVTTVVFERSFKLIDLNLQISDQLILFRDTFLQGVYACYRAVYYTPLLYLLTMLICLKILVAHMSNLLGFLTFIINFNPAVFKQRVIRNQCRLRLWQQTCG